VISYRLTPSAKSDLRSIILYTVSEWGIEQNDRYIAKLDECFAKIGRHEFPARRFHKKFPEILVTRCEHHLVFYLKTEPKNPVPIIAVLHERMDLIIRIKSRLK